MKKLVIAPTVILLSTILSMPVKAQVNWSCKNVYADEAVEVVKISDLKTNFKSLELGSIESNIRDLESKIKTRSYRKISLQSEINGRFDIPYFLKTEKLKGFEKELKSEQDAIERESRMLKFTKEDLEEAKLSIEKQKNGTGKSKHEKPGFLTKFGLLGKKVLTIEELQKLEEKIIFLEKNITIRLSNVDFYKNEISIEVAPIKENALKEKKFELAEIEQKDIRDQNALSTMKQNKAQLLEANRQQGVKVLSKLLKDNRLRTPIQDLLSYYSLKSLSSGSKVTILAGNALTGTNRIDYATSMELKNLINGLVQKKYHIVFDAESPYAPYLSQLAGDLAIPVLSSTNTKFSEHKNKVVISNDYLRMQILADSKAVISTTDSVTGLGMYTEGLVTHMLDLKNSFETTSLAEWVKDLDKKNRNLGITARSVKSIRHAGELFKKSEFSIGNTSDFTVPIDGFKSFQAYKHSDLSIESIERVISEATSYAQVMEQNKGTGGSVIFGSSKEDKHSANLIYQTAFKLGRLGIAVATGGADGAMKIANTGAWNSGGISLGIIIGGRLKLETEKEAASSVHTKTIVTSGYEERIPTLLGEGLDSRKMIIFAPGGNGTIKELAVTLVRSASKFSSVKKIVFLDSDYYGPLFNWLKNANLPQSFKDKLVIFDKAEDFEVMAKKLQDSTESARIREIRKDQQTYEVKSYSYQNNLIDNNYSGKWSSDTKPKPHYKNKYAEPSVKPENKGNNNKANDTNTHFKDPSEEMDYYRDLYGNYYD
jgi:predicted Rossmann-fold nucleotide-binding protein